jgi:hypothetical protein
MSDVDFSQNDSYEPDPTAEQIVQFFVNRIRKGLPVKMPILMKRQNGRFVVVDGIKRLAAARRCGDEAVSAYVIDELDPQTLRDLREDLNGDNTQRN